jgi:hypothetical protein
MACGQKNVYTGIVKHHSNVAGKFIYLPHPIPLCLRMAAIFLDNIAMSLPFSFYCFSTFLPQNSLRFMVVI